LNVPVAVLVPSVAVTVTLPPAQFREMYVVVAVGLIPLLNAPVASVYTPGE
jgi:hypothetical protein